MNQSGSPIQPEVVTKALIGPTTLTYNETLAVGDVLEDSPEVLGA